MTNKNLTDITLIVDRSGSMTTMREEAEKGINDFITQQRKDQSGDAVLSLVQFDNEYEIVYDAVPIDNVWYYKLEPRWSTALLDAVGKTINKTGERLRNMPENQRPGLVIFVIATDGHENSSKEFTKGQIQQMVKCQQENYNWQFIFIGANQDSFAEAHSMGLVGAVSNYKNAVAAYNSSSSLASRMRDAVKTRGFVVSSDNAFTEEEKTSMNS